jgi:hypothetical protein
MDIDFHEKIIDSVVIVHTLVTEPFPNLPFTRFLETLAMGFFDGEIELSLGTVHRM